MLAYVFSALLPGFQSLLEGRWPAWLVSIFVPVQVRQLESLELQRHENDLLRAGLENLREYVGWSLSTDFNAGAVMRPINNNPGDFLFIAAASGKTGVAMPTFPQIQGQTVSDGDVTWKNIGAVPKFGTPVDLWTLRLREARILGAEGHQGRNTFDQKEPAAKAVAE
jgi:hypothetical protein